VICKSRSISTGCPSIVSQDAAAVLVCSGTTKLMLCDRAVQGTLSASLTGPFKSWIVSCLYPHSGCSAASGWSVRAAGSGDIEPTALRNLSFVGTILSTVCTTSVRLLPVCDLPDVCQCVGPVLMCNVIQTVGVCCLRHDTTVYVAVITNFSHDNKLRR
jgi:hypothetical protein